MVQGCLARARGRVTATALTRADRADPSGELRPVWVELRVAPLTQNSARCNRNLLLYQVLEHLLFLVFQSSEYITTESLPHWQGGAGALQLTA